jgi:TolB-like protein/Tfp pilus assembly protein PilF
MPEEFQFGPFRLMVPAGDLYKGPSRIRLQDQPLTLLRLLLEEPGELVSRDKIRDTIWPGGTIVEFDHSINTAVNKLRSALSDDVEKPRYIETLARKGYRFLAPVEHSKPEQPGDHGPSIAILPFANMSPGPDDEYFSDGLAEEITHALAHVPGLKVTARTSAFAFRGREQDLTRIAEALRVRTILEGSVRRSGSRVRVTAQLINAADGYHLWSERYDRELTDVFAIQDEIAQSIVSALQVKLDWTPPKFKPKFPAYEALLQGRHHRQKFTPDAHARAKECFEQAIALDPSYAAPHAELGMSYLWLAQGLSPMIEVADLIRAEAQKALELDPSESGPNFLLGAVAAAYDYDWEASATYFEKAMNGNSASSDARYAYAGYYLQPLRRSQEAVEQMQRAVELDPLNVAWRAMLAFHLSTAGMHDRGFEEVRKGLAINENHWVANVVIAEAYLLAGKLPEALAAAERAYSARPYSNTRGLLAATLVRIGEKDRATSLIREGGDSPRPIWGSVLYHVLCLKIDAAADCYEEMIRQREPAAVNLVGSPAIQPLRESPRWPKLARMMNLPASG